MVPFGFRRQVSWVTQEHSSKFLLAAPGIRQRASRRTRSMRLSRTALSSWVQVLTKSRLMVPHEEAHQQDKPTVICFPPFIRSLRFLRTSPGGPSPCLSHDRTAFGYDAASALSPARWHARVPSGAKRYESSPVPHEEVLATRSCVLSAGRSKEQSLGDDGTPRTAAVPFWFRCLSRFTCLDLRHVARFCCAEALFVSIGCRGSPLARSARPSGYIVSGLPTPESAAP